MIQGMRAKTRTTESSVPSSDSTIATGTRKAEILGAAADLFMQSGYTGTTVKDIADACGVLPGSLYHHFTSKEEIAADLVDAYQSDLNEIGRRALKEASRARADSVDQIRLDVEITIAECGARHRAALELMTYEAPRVRGQESAGYDSVIPPSYVTALRELLARAQAFDQIDERVDTSILADELAFAMHRLALPILQHDAAVDEVARALHTITMYGLAIQPPQNAALARSDAMAAARETIRSWGDPSRSDGGDADSKTARLRAAARIEFARRGYEATTVRDIAATAGMPIATVYRLMESKEALLISIMDQYYARLSDAYNAAVATRSSTIEKLDALSWLNLNLLDKSQAEFSIQRAWPRSSPPATSHMVTAISERFRQLWAVLTEGIRAGEIRDPGLTPDTFTSCVMELLWPAMAVANRGKRAALLYTRMTVLRGAMARHR